MISAFGVEHTISKMYQERRIATKEDLATGEWHTKKFKKPGKIKRALRPKAAKKQAAKASQPYYATRWDEQGSGNKTALSHGPLGDAKDVKRFSRYVGGEYDPKGRKTY